MGYSVANRYAYLSPINRWFGKHYSSLDEYKKRDEFQSILDQYITIDSVFKAIERARAIEHDKKEKGAKRFDLLGHGIYQENPSTTVHEVVQLMLDTCYVRR